VIGGNSGLKKLGANLLTLSNSNTYTGVTTISGGTLSVATVSNAGTASNLGAGSSVVFDGGSLLYTGATASSNKGFAITNGLTGKITVQNAGTTLTLSGGSSASTGNLTKAGAGTLKLTGASAYTGDTVVQAGALEMTEAAYLPVITAGSSTGLDLQAGKVVLDYAGGTDPAATIKSLLTSGYGTGWATGQIRSSTATGVRGLGWKDDTGASQVTIAYTVYGDANLDGAVSLGDLAQVLANYNKSGVNWADGDFNYDNTVNLGDLAMLLADYGLSASSSSIDVSGYALDSQAVSLLTTSGFTVVPEPSSVVLLGLALSALAAVGVVRRRK